MNQYQSPVVIIADQTTTGNNEILEPLNKSLKDSGVKFIISEIKFDSDLDLNDVKLLSWRLK